MCAERWDYPQAHGGYSWLALRDCSVLHILSRRLLLKGGGLSREYGISSLPNCECHYPSKHYIIDWLKTDFSDLVDMASEWAEKAYEVSRLSLLSNLGLMLNLGEGWNANETEYWMGGLGPTCEGQIKVVYWYFSFSFFLLTWFIIHISNRPFIRWCHRWWKCLRMNPHQRRGRIRYSDKWTWTMMVRCGQVLDHLNSFWIEMTKWPGVIIKQKKCDLIK